jgi:putative ABC transport system permease protein
MNKLWMHANANIRKTRSVSATLVGMFVIAAFLLNAGLLVVINYGGFFNTLKEELMPADVYYMLPDALYTDEVRSFLDESEHIRKTQENGMMLLDSKISSKGKEQSFNILFGNMDEQREISKWKFVGEHLPAEEMSVYVPDIFKAVSGYQLNDKIELKYTDEATGIEKTLSFTVKGYTEDIFFSSNDTGFMGFYLTSETYQKVADIINNPNASVNVVFVNLDDADNSKTVESEIREILHLNSASTLSGDASSLFVVIDLELVEMSRCMMASMVSVMMVVFSMIIVGVCLLVVRFRIINSIEEDVMKIGSLKAIGYTSRQIMLSVILQFSLIAGAGSLAGIALSYPALPAVAAVFEQQSGLKWEQGFDGVISTCALFMLLLIVVLVAWVAARRLSRLSPISALRGETSMRKYKRNRLPLEKTKGRLPVVLAFKSVLQSMKQNIMIAIILISVTFAGAFGVIMFYNTTIDTKAFAEVPGMEICNAIAVLNP